MVINVLNWYLESTQATSRMGLDTMVMLKDGLECGEWGVGGYLLW